jgi:methionyl-tRNA formyltransferase
MAHLPRVVFMGTPEFAVPTLAGLIQGGWPVVGVVTQPDRPVGRGQKVTMPPVKELALAYGLVVAQPERIRNNADFLTWLADLRPELLVVVAYGKILPAIVLDLPRLGCVNVHASLLPKYRGAAPIQWAVMNGETVTGVTLMKMDQGMDTGPLLGSASLAIAPEDTAATLSPRLAQLGAELALAQLPQYVAGKLEPVAQQDADATMAPLLTKCTGWVDWTRAAQVIRDQIRGVQPWPGARAQLDGIDLKIGSATVVARGGDVQPGTVLDVDQQGWHVACGCDTLVLQTLQMPGKPMRQAVDVARGLSGHSPIGRRLTVGEPTA